ncbi:hypothetical protein [Desulfosporosinus fructosivorans]|nr:hypothetical protein [Desulfosporosinus fructosivorans]
MQDFLADEDAVAQAIKTSLLLLRGEWWEDTGDGLPLFQNILGQSGTQEHLTSTDLLIKDRILSTQGVSQIQSFQSSYANRRYNVENCTVLTNTGQTVTVTGVTF